MVRQQAEVGIDIVSDGEFSKGLNWAFYIFKRLKGIAVRPATPEEMQDPMASMAAASDRQAFPEFYAEYDAATGLGQTARQSRRRQRADYLLRPEQQVGRDINNINAGLAKAQAASTRRSRASCRWWRRRARCRAPRSSTTRTRRRYLFALAEALHQEYKAIVDAGLYVQIDDAFLPYMHERMVPPMSNARVSALGADAH